MYLHGIYRCVCTYVSGSRPIYNVTLTLCYSYFTYTDIQKTLSYRAAASDAHCGDNLFHKCRVAIMAAAGGAGT